MSKVPIQKDSIPEPIRRNIVSYILEQYRNGSLGPNGGVEKVYSAVGHLRLFTRGKISWIPHPREAASCCLNKKNTIRNTKVLLNHCHTRTHLDHLSKEKPSSILARVSSIPIEAFDISKAPTLINHFNQTIREVALMTLKDSYIQTPP